MSFAGAPPVYLSTAPEGGDAWTGSRRACGSTPRPRRPRSSTRRSSRTRDRRVTHYTEAGPGPTGDGADRGLHARRPRFIALNGGPQFTFTEAISFLVDWRTQAEVDRYWESSADGGEDGPCGWLKDRYGLRGRSCPKQLYELIARPRPRARPACDRRDAADDEDRDRRAGARRRRRRHGVIRVPLVKVHITVSVDGYAAGPDQSLRIRSGKAPEALHEWAIATRGLARAARSGGRGVGRRRQDRRSPGAKPRRRPSWAGTCSAPSAGRGRTRRGGAGGAKTRRTTRRCSSSRTTRARRSSWRGGTTFHFVTDGIESALEQAVAAADGKDITIGGGASTVQQYLRAGLVDELNVHVAPVLLGAGGAAVREPRRRADGARVRRARRLARGGALPVRPGALARTRGHGRRRAVVREHAPARVRGGGPRTASSSAWARIVFLSVLRRRDADGLRVPEGMAGKRSSHPSPRSSCCRAGSDFRFNWAVVRLGTDRRGGDARARVGRLGAGRPAEGLGGVPRPGLTGSLVWAPRRPARIA